MDNEQNDHLKAYGLVYYVLSKFRACFIINSILALFGSKVDQVQGRFALLPGVLFLLTTYRFFQISNKGIKYLTIFIFNIPSFMFKT